MKHGYVMSQTFAGTEMHPKLRFIVKKIGLSISTTYRFIGYRSSILRHMYDTQDHLINGKNKDNFTIHIKIAEVSESGEQAIINNFRGAALGVAGGMVSAIDAMNTVLDGISVAGYVRDMVPGGESAPSRLKRPGKLAYMKDHALNGRIVVDLTMNKAPKTGWIDSGEQELPMSAVAQLVKAA